MNRQNVARDVKQLVGKGDWDIGTITRATDRLTIPNDNRKGVQTNHR